MTDNELIAALLHNAGPDGEYGEMADSLQREAASRLEQLVAERDALKAVASRVLPGDPAWPNAVETLWHMSVNDRHEADRLRASLASAQEEIAKLYERWPDGLDEIEASVTGWREHSQKLEEEKDGAYLERNQCVALIAKMALSLGLKAGTARTAIEGWSEDWHGCVYIDLPDGQVSWHYHDSQAHLFADLPAYDGAWDGHDTPEKYRRVNAYRAQEEIEGLRRALETVKQTALDVSAESLMIPSSTYAAVMQALAGEQK